MMHKPKLLLNVLDTSLLASLFNELLSISTRKQECNPAYRVLLGYTGVHWKYADKTVPAIEWTPTSYTLLNKVNSLLLTNYNSATGYIYSSEGQVYPHSDYSYITNIVSNTFAIASFGGTRTLKFSNGDEYKLYPGSLLIIPKEYDMSTMHHLEKEPGTPTSVSLTFRTLS